MAYIASSVTSFRLLFSSQVLSDSLWPHGLQHARFPVLHYLPEFPQTRVHWLSRWYHPTSHFLLPTSPLALNLSQHLGLCQWVGSLKHVAKVLEHQLQHQSFQDYSGLISFGIDWFYLLAVQGTQEYSPATQLKASILRRIAFFMVQSHIHTRLLEKP